MVGYKTERSGNLPQVEEICLRLHMPAEWLVLVSGGLGAAGAIGAQIVAARYTARREAQKITVDRAIGIEERFFPLRYETYGKFLTLDRETIRAAFDFRDDRKERESEVQKFYSALGQLRRLQADLDLVSPNTAQVVDNALKALTGYFDKIYEAHRGNSGLAWDTDEEVARAIRACEQAMRRELGFEST